MVLTGRATAAGTARYAERFLSSAKIDSARPLPDFFRQALGLSLSSIGGGTYLGDVSDSVDDRYRIALTEAVRQGCNVLDTAVNYRAQRSEIVLGQTIAELVASDEFSREELVVASKGGFIAHRLAKPADPVQYIYDNFVAAGVVEPDDLAGGIHCMTPNYLSQQITWSLRNLGLRTVDIYYLHNPETQLAFVDWNTFQNRLKLAFSRLEEEVMSGRIGCYGVATWEGLRRPPRTKGYLSLEWLVELAREVAGADHHLQVVQMPISAAVREAVTFRNQPVAGKLLTSLSAAQRLGLTVMASASIMQAQVTGRVQNLLADTFQALKSGPLRALQFTRSLPGVTTALVGMSRAEHVRENMALAAHPPDPDRALRMAQELKR